MDNFQAMNQEFFDLINNETNKMLSSLSSDQTQQTIQQFNQQWNELASANITDPTSWLNNVANFQQQQVALWNQLLTEQSPPAANESAPGDDSVPLQQLQNQIFDYIKKSYQITSNILSEVAANAGLEEHEQQKLDFYTKQYTDAMSPDNFATTNPEVINEAIRTNGQSLVDGLKNLICDMEKGRISMTDEKAFSLGENIATTEGAVIYENELFQLIHYKPRGEQVYSKPTLIVPPCINKFYILDLQPHNSFVNYCVGQGQNTFLISWLNPSKQQGHLKWDDYVEDGIINAIGVVNDIANTKSLNAVSWCVGGTLLASSLAVLAKRNQKPVNSATFLTTLLDFSEPGEISVFIDQPQVDALLHQAKQQGVLSGRQLSTAFNMLRANDLIWSYVVNNYLKGKQPAPFDILYWNGDSTNLPYEMYQFYIRQMYLNNNLSSADELTIAGESIDLSSIDIPCYFLSTISDHIAPWKSTFKGTELLSGDNEFVLGASGHVAGVINPVSKNRRHYWADGQLDTGADNWLETAEKHDGSWWAHWDKWLKKRAGKKVKAPEYGNEKHQVIEPAPGRYVKIKIDDMD
ncbi:alpha/beta hydrolase [Psychrobium sp. 1_MG-2023]|uniref:PHA/PHB synthase family protein n=1 Tax=Psychrobium sp. 1_MG-2023 TaxID=3062624 RepID=UPI000C325BBA|nr:class I poly(R)-hydroxyalkanoic acid synthase [Psychrobium sp. 1_MG-2023]MDP2559759.1 class I poly(R)-hydroxyalkanoic acid synthase [Psychrobium sp. 1_MG-2023]PKF59133.1 class I poly(R)-hydroxyalkanoic acid synthase [Alteromonadales bacterium alter-6D02]